MSIEKYQWHVLEDFTNQFGFTKGVELGVRWGQTSRYLLDNVSSLSMVGVDLMKVQPEKTKPGQETYSHWPWQQYQDSVDKIKEKYPDRWELMIMDTTEASKLFEDESIDFVFIDADHSYEGVKTDIENWMPKVKKTGLIVGHDINLDGVKKAVEEKFLRYGTRWQAWNNCWWSSHDHAA